MATREEKIALRNQGLTYREIAAKLGISHQAVAQVLSVRQPSKFRFMTEKTCVYKGLRDWLNKNEITRAELVRRLGLEPVSANLTRWGGYLQGGKLMPKTAIDRLLKVTGLTYEQAFGEDGSK